MTDTMVGMPDDVVDRYMKADAAFAKFRHDTDGALRSEDEWDVYLEWAEATAEYVQHLGDAEHGEQQPVLALNRIRDVLRAPRPASAIRLRLVTIVEAASPGLISQNA